MLAKERAVILSTSPSRGHGVIHEISKVCQHLASWYNILLSSMAHRQWLWKLDSYREKHSFLVTNSAPLHILSYSSSHLNINGNGFSFKISMDPTAMTLIRMENWAGGWGKEMGVQKLRIKPPNFSAHPFHSFFIPVWGILSTLAASVF